MFSYMCLISIGIILYQPYLILINGLLSNEYGLTIWFSQDELMLITHQSIMTTTNDYAHVWLCSECSCLTLGGICWLDTHLVRCIETHLFSFRCSRHVVSVKDPLDAIHIHVAYIYVNTMYKLMLWVKFEDLDLRFNLRITKIYSEKHIGILSFFKIGFVFAKKSY